MASESIAPPPSGGGNAKYALIGVALFAVAGLTWCLTQPGEAPPDRPVAAAVDAGTAPAPVEEEFEIPELEPDAGPVDAGTVAENSSRPSRTRAWDDCSGDIPVADVRRVVGEYSAQIRNCYERQLKQNPVLEGNITLAVRVAADGHADGAQFAGSLRDRNVTTCIRNVVSHMRFPAPGGRDCAIIQVPYSFSPQR